MNITPVLAKSRSVRHQKNHLIPPDEFSAHGERGSTRVDARLLIEHEFRLFCRVEDDNRLAEYVDVDNVALCDVK